MRTPLARTLLLSLAALPAFAACDKLPARAPKTAFNADSALSYTQASRSPSDRACPARRRRVKAGDWIVAMMKPRADTVIEQRWMHKTADGKDLPLRNILARFNPHGDAAHPLRHALGHAADGRHRSRARQSRHADPRRERRRGGRRDCSSHSATRSRRRRPTSASTCSSSTARTTARASIRRTRTSSSAHSTSPSICRAPTTGRSSACCGT